MLRMVTLLSTFLLVGCAVYRPVTPPKTDQPSVSPLAEAGVGVTIWKVPVVGIGAWGMGAAPVAIVYQYNYQAVPKPTVSGIPVDPPGPPQPVVPPTGEQLKEQPPAATPTAALPPPVPLQTVYPSAPFDDPSLVIFQNASDRKTFLVSIDGKPEFKLEPRRITPNLYLNEGDHQVRIRGHVSSAQFGPLAIPERLFPLRIQAEGSWQLIVLH